MSKGPSKSELPPQPTTEAPQSTSVPEVETPSRYGYEGDYRPMSSAGSSGGNRAGGPGSSLIEAHSELPQVEFLMRLADALNTTLDLETLLRRVANLVRAVIEYRIFAILLINERSRDLRMRFQIGHTSEAERLRIPLGKGVVGQAAEQRQPILVEDVNTLENYIEANPAVRSELAVPLITRNRVIGVIDIQSEEPAFFRPEHLRLLQLTASRVAIAIENARLYTRIARQAETLSVLNEIGREITSILDLDPLLERIGELLHRVIDYRMFSILLWNESKQVLEHQLSVRFGEVVHFDQVIPVGIGIVGAAARDKVPVLASDIRKDPRYVMLNPETRSELAVPLLHNGKTIGVLDLEHTRRGYFTEDHLKTLTTLASQVAVAIVNAQLYQRLRQEEQRLESDLAMARQVQLRLLPQTLPQHTNAEFAARFIAARTIGGDLYDFQSYNSDCTAIALGDVSGKAAPAALYAALVSGIMRSYAAQQPSPSAILAQVNDSLHERRLDSQYVTMLYALWNDDKRELHIANAGSVQPLFCRSGEVVTIQAAGFPLGMFPNVTYEEFTVSTQPGDAIIFFSDGIVDAENSTGDMYGSERLEAIVRQNVHASAEQMVIAILAAVTEFQGGQEHFDDETVLVLKVRGGEPPMGAKSGKRAAARGGKSQVSLEKS